jgi:hypothetical protein
MVAHPVDRNAQALRNVFGGEQDIVFFYSLWPWVYRKGMAGRHEILQAAIRKFAASNLIRPQKPQQPFHRYLGAVVISVKWPHSVWLLLQVAGMFPSDLAEHVFQIDQFDMT